MPDVARLHAAYVWVPGGYGDQTNGFCINQTHGPHHWALQMTPVGQIDIHLQHAFLGVSGGSFGPHVVPSVSIQRAACSPARHGPGDTPAVVPITDTHHKRHLPAQYGRRSEPERVRSSRRRVHVGRRPCVVVGGLPLTNTHNALPRWCLCDRHHPRCVCEGAGRPWTWLCGRRAAAEARRPTEAHTREEGRTSRVTKISGLGCQQTPFRQPSAVHGS